MKRLASVAAILAFWLGAVSFSFCQNQLDNQPCPEVAEDAVGCELIAWSPLRAPAPLPDATSPPDQPKEKPEASSEARNSGVEVRRSQSVQTLLGVIIKNQGEYCLRVGPGLDIRLVDDERMAQRHEGERVRINGVLDAGRKALHIGSIGPF